MANAPYVLLNDQPIGDTDGDLLSTSSIAGGIASLLVASKGSSPFTLAIDAGWGMGKSTVLHQIEFHLRDSSDITTLQFNAWTAEGDNALAGLIKSVLGEVDPNIIRRWVTRLAKQQNAMLLTRIGISMAARFFGVGRLIDELWTRLGGDSKSRNEMRDVIHRMLAEWVNHNNTSYDGQALVVFIDDLDRCSDDVVVKVCEAVKLYLDIPGLIFVLACDLSVLARCVSSAARGGAGEGRMYLEKIVQVVYRVPMPEEQAIKALIEGYAAAAGISDAIDQNVAQILAEGTERNPRKIKRIINSFVMEYGLDPSWRLPPLGSAQLVRAVLLQQLYSPLYTLLLREDSGEDPIGELLDYVTVREQAAEPPGENLDDPWWDAIRRLFQARKLALRFPSESAEKELSRLEKELPEDFMILARNASCIALLQGIGDEEARKSFRSQLIRRPLTTIRVAQAQDLITLPSSSQAAAFMSLEQAVRDAYGEGSAFGRSVARDAPTAWMEAVLARQPRMPSDLEARMLQASQLPIDFLLHDEVRHALRSGFWDGVKYFDGSE
jgi:KAP family P-loop domain